MGRPIRAARWYGASARHHDAVRGWGELVGDSSRWLLSLNGVWKFQLSPNPASRPADFYQPNFNDSSWPTIRVPGSWELQGFGTPIYVNAGYAFAFDCQNPRPPHDDNPVGSYRTAFSIPEHWAGRRVYLQFGGVDSAFYVWVNGRRIGYSEDSRTPAEFDVTSASQAGDEQLAVEVYRFGDGAFLEDQDMWRMSGIFRDVYLVERCRAAHSATSRSRPISMTQYRDGTVQIRATWRTRATSRKRCASQAELLADDDRQGRPVTGNGACRREVVDTEVRLSIPVENPRKWTAETPNLYRLLLTLKRQPGRAAGGHPARTSASARWKSATAASWSTARPFSSKA